MQRTSVEPPPYQIHHYPASLIDTRTLRRGQRLTLRPVLPQDCLLLGELMVDLSPAARRQRFHGAVRLSAARLLQMCCVDYAQQLALVVTTPVDGTERVIADARYCIGDDRSAEFALVVDGHWRRLGIGAWMLGTLERAALAAGVGTLQGAVQPGNTAMLGLAQRCGFQCGSQCGANGGLDGSDQANDGEVVNVERRLDTAATATSRVRRAMAAWWGRSKLASPPRSVPPRATRLAS